MIDEKKLAELRKDYNSHDNNMPPSKMNPIFDALGAYMRVARAAEALGNDCRHLSRGYDPLCNHCKLMDALEAVHADGKR